MISSWSSEALESESCNCFINLTRYSSLLAWNFSLSISRYPSEHLLALSQADELILTLLAHPDSKLDPMDNDLEAIRAVRQITVLPTLSLLTTPPCASTETYGRITRFKPFFILWKDPSRWCPPGWRRTGWRSWSWRSWRKR